ncbi:amino acid ABC transporter ATP-binding protein [Clostridium sp. Cult3]|uniref:amino acid ABC transporter ATP-binding protein n=1 Tax=Clostridium sp. Cult3 TaxID=2079004 RepID=UPI001F21CCFE|nr:amino acid ABC transporter ATP-binding protein [Clostridium sp. Cult3]MCF6460391.1 polar amino acid ABC transporter ATP-binding protein [Clostridium sp. Cult3]
MNKEEKIVLEVYRLNKSFGGKQVLKDISFQLKAGEILAIIGPSGAGKTTILRCISNLEKCDSGIIKIDGQHLCDDCNGKSIYAKTEEMKCIREKIGLVFQNYNLFPHMSVIENIIEAPINVLGIPKEEAIDKALALLNIMGLKDKADSYPFQLSGGQKQRVAIARACMLNPKIMCFDEPTSALDPELREGVANIIEELASNGMSVLIITHDMFFAERVANKIIFMEDGQIIQESKKDDFFNDFQDDRIRKYMT